MLLREEVAAFDRAAGDIGCQFAPDLERATVVDVPGPKRSGSAPEGEHRAGDPASALTVGNIVLTVDARRRPILLADRVKVVWVTQLREVFRARVVVERVRRRAPLEAQ